jgi:hypothetical protein
MGGLLSVYPHCDDPALALAVAVLAAEDDDRYVRAAALTAVARADGIASISSAPVQLQPGAPVA